MERTTIKQLYKDPTVFAGKEITVAGWTRTIRASNAFGFIELNDGSFFRNLQVVFDACAAPKEKHIVKGAEHAVSVLWFPEEYWKTVDAFLDKYLYKEAPVAQK